MPGAQRPIPPTDPDDAGARMIDQVRRYARDPAHDALTRTVALRHLLAELPALCDEAILAAHAGGTSWARIAAAIGLQSGSVNQAEHRLRVRDAALREAG